MATTILLLAPENPTEVKKALTPMNKALTDQISDLKVIYDEANDTHFVAIDGADLADNDELNLEDEDEYAETSLSTTRPVTSSTTTMTAKSSTTVFSSSTRMRR